jgi:hypothetical protein
MRASIYPVPTRLTSAPQGAEAADGGLSHGDASRRPPRLVEEHKEVLRIRQQLKDVLSRRS